LARSERRFAVTFLGRPAILLAAVFFWSGAVYAEAVRAAPNYGAIRGLEAVKDQQPAPEFTLANPDGRKVSLKDFRGKVVFLNFWATWCEYCREEMPAMERLYQEFRGKGLEIVGVNVKDKRSDALAFVKKLRVTYPIVLDPDGQVGLLYGAFGMPLSYLIDRNGTVLARLFGPADWYSPEARALIKTLVEQQ
jgi:DsbE subfamily thiol:disulfide oxidoreductase